MPAFIAAANPTFSGIARTRTPSRSPTSRDPSVEALSTRSVSHLAPRCARADPSEIGRSATSSFETMMIETSNLIRLVRSAPESQPEHAAVRAGRLGTRPGNVPSNRQKEQPQAHSRREQGAVGHAPDRAIARRAIAQSVAVEDRQEPIVAEPGRRISAAVPEAGLGQEEDPSFAPQPFAEIHILVPGG